MHTFSFNRPLTLLFALPLLVMVTMFVWGLTVEFKISLLIMLLVTAGLFVLLFYYSQLRRLRVGEDKAIWITPRQRYEMPLSEVRHFGIVKFRRFRFIYLSRAETVPFQDPSHPVVTDPDTFIIQFRPNAWNILLALVKASHPRIQPESFARQ